MHVLFSDYNEWFEELRDASAADQIEESTVRVCSRVTSDAETGFTEIFLCASFLRGGFPFMLEQPIWNGLAAQIEAEGIHELVKAAEKGLLVLVKGQDLKPRGGRLVP